MPRWRISLGSEAERDFVEIIGYTERQFGQRQAQTYKTTISRALQALQRGPLIIGSVPRDDLGEGYRFFHVARQGRGGRHFIVYRAVPERTIRVCASFTMPWISSATLQRIDDTGGSPTPEGD